MRKVTFILFSLTALILWATVIEPRWLDVTEHSVRIEGLPTPWVGKKIAFMSDFQVGMYFGNESTVSNAVDVIIEHKPEVVLIGGDFIYHPTDDDKDEWDNSDRIKTEKLIDTVVNLLKPMTDADINVLAVLGNHDYSMNKSSSHMVSQTAKLLSDRLESINIKVLNNESVKFIIDNEALFFVGIAPFYPKLSDPKTALKNVDGARVLFMHNANAVDTLSDDKVDFVVAGHTHGGQIRIPGFPGWSWTSLVPHAPDDVMGDGWIKDYKNKDHAKLYVNRGIGFSTVPVRLNCRPELSFFKLNSQ